MIDGGDLGQRGNRCLLCARETVIMKGKQVSKIHYTPINDSKTLCTLKYKKVQLILNVLAINK